MNIFISRLSRGPTKIMKIRDRFQAQDTPILCSYLSSIFQKNIFAYHCTWMLAQFSSFVFDLIYDNKIQTLGAG